MYLNEIETIRLSMTKKNAEIVVGKNSLGKLVTKKRFQYKAFMIIRHIDGDMMDFDGMKAGDVDNVTNVINQVYGQFKCTSGSGCAYMNSFFMVPLYIGATELKYLYFDIEKVNGVSVVKVFESEEPLVVLDKPLDVKDIGLWSDNPDIYFKDILEPYGYVVEGLSKFNSKTEPEMELESNINMLDIVRKVRIGIGNTIINNLYHTYGPERYDAIKKQYGEDDKLIKVLYDDFKGLLDVQNKNLNDKGEPKRITSINFKGTTLIPTYMMYNNMMGYHAQMLTEARLEKNIEIGVKKHPFWTRYLEGIRGCGTLHAGYIIARLDPTVGRHPSSFIRYLGLDVVENENGERVGRNRSMVRPMTYLKSDGSVGINKTRGYNAEMKSRIWLLAGNMLKAHDPKYEAIYRGAVEYYTNRPDLKDRWERKKNGEKVHGTVHGMAFRKMMCQFVIDLWLAERQILGLPLNGGTYAEEKLGIHHGYDHLPEIGE